MSALQGSVARRLRARARAAASATAVVAALGAASCDCSLVVKTDLSGREELAKGTDVCGRVFFQLFKALGAPDGPDPFKGPGLAPRAARRPAPRTERNSLTLFAPAGLQLPNVAEVPVPLDLVPPFRVECTTGLCDPAFDPAETAVFGMSVYERVADRREFAAECSRVGGITVTASFGSPTPRAFAGATRVDLAFEHDGTDIVLSARDRTIGGAWSEVSRAPAASAGPFLPRFEALNFEPGQMVTFFRLRVPSNAPYAEDQVPPQVAAVRHFAEALTGFADAAETLSAGDRDAAGAQERLLAARASVQAALGALAAPAAPGKRLTPEARRLTAARKESIRAARGVSQVVKTLSRAGARRDVASVRQIYGAALGLVRAGDRILPSELRTELGGLTLKQLLGK